MKEDLLIIRADVDSVMYASITERVRAAQKAENLVIAMETPGGDPMYAYRAMNFLRKEYKYIDFVVFDMAMSAGTLMALGADRICFANGACLGPLDLQISHPNPADDTRISTLDVRDTAGRRS